MCLDARKPDLHVNNKAADHPAHLCSLISAFVIYYLQSIAVSVAKQTGLSLFEVDFSRVMAHIWILPLSGAMCIWFWLCVWVKVFRIIPEFRIFRLTFHRKSASKC